MKKAVLICLLGVSSAVHAEQGFDLVLSAGLTSGGDTLAETTTGGTLKSGGLFLGSIGTVYSFEGSNFQIQGSIGYHFDELTADNGSADFSRFTLELLPFYQISEKMRLGVGIINASAVDYSDPVGSIEFDDANGVVFELDWKLRGNSWWGVRYTDIEYDLAKLNGMDISSLGFAPIDGSYIGLMFHAGF